MAQNQYRAGIVGYLNVLSAQASLLAGQRSLNLSNAVAVTVFEAWRQNSFAMPGGEIPTEPEGTIISGFAQLG